MENNSATNVSNWIRSENIKFVQKLLRAEYVLIVLLSLYGLLWVPLIILFSIGAWQIIAGGVLILFFNASLLFQVSRLAKQAKYSSKIQLKTIAVSTLLVGLISLCVSSASVLRNVEKIGEASTLIKLSIFLGITLVGYTLVWVTIRRGIEAFDAGHEQLIQLTTEEMHIVRRRDRRIGYALMGSAFGVFVVLVVLTRVLNVSPGELYKSNGFMSLLANLPLWLFVLSLFYILRQRKFS
jgi:hypothetical protein